jgi:hypothetical protein
MQYIKTLAAAVIYFFSVSVLAAAPSWYAFNRESGCVPIESEMSELRVSNLSTPGSILDAYNRVEGLKTKMVPFIVRVNEELSKAGEKLPPDGREFYKHFNMQNAFIFYDDKNEFRFAIASASLCESLMSMGRGRK